MKIATTTDEIYPFTDSDPVQSVPYYEGTGFRYLDYSFYASNRPGCRFLTEDWLGEVEETAAAAEELGLRFVQAHSPNYNPFRKSEDAAYHEAGMKATLRSIEACGRLGIPNIVVHTGYGPQCLYPQDREDYFQKNKAFLSAFFPAAEKWNVRICIENSADAIMGNSWFFRTAREMNDFISYVDHPLLGACWDTGHGNLQGNAPYEEIITLGKNLHAIHFQDNNGKSDLHHPPLTGTLDVDAVMRGLTEIDFAGPLTFEADHLLSANHYPGPLGQPPKRVIQAELRLLHEIGVACLEAYGLSED